MAKLSKSALVLQILAHRDAGRGHYIAADECQELLLAQVRPGEIIKLPDGRTAEVLDLFATKNKVFRQHGIGRFELKVHEAK